MTASDMLRQRLHHQRLSSPDFTQPDDVVKWLGAIQAQDYAGAKWAVGQRMQAATDAAIEMACAEGTILRTHVMRPTWHFVAPADIRWMLTLTAPRVNARMAPYYRKAELDDAVFRRSHKALARALRGGRHLAREPLRRALQRAGIATDGLRFIFLLLRAELDGVICSGGRSGKQITYALLDERVPAGKDLTRDEALAEITRRYFVSHGPATVQDFVWWSGLTTRDAKTGLDMVRRHLVQDTINGRTYWLSASMRAGPRAPRRAHLLPTFDEYLIAYRDRSAAFDPASRDKSRNAQFNSTIVWDGRVVGTWKRTLEKSAVIVTLSSFAALRNPARRAVTEAAQRYGAFLGLKVVLAGRA
jgi:DNA glycosylase AlkZ-like